MAFDYSTVDLPAILQRAYDQMDEMQRPAVAKARKSGRVIFDMYMGTGKTFAALTAGLCFRPQRWQIICSKNAINAFRQEIAKWFPEFSDPKLFCIVRGTKLEREAAYKTGALFFITTGGSFIRDLDFLVTNNIGFDVVTIDEADKVGLRNHKSQTFKATKALISKDHFEKHRRRLEKLNLWVETTRHKVSLVNICTGTLTSKGVPQLFGYLHLMDPKLFSSYWKFIGTFMYVVDGPFGKVATIPRNTDALAEVTYPHIWRVSEKDAAKYLPPIRRIRLPFEPSPRVRELYNQMAEELFFLIPEAPPENMLQFVNSTLAQSMRLRQLLCCPGIIDPSLGAGEAIEAITDKIHELDEAANYTHNVIFSPFLDAIPFFVDHCQNSFKLKSSQIIVMKGGMEPEEVQEAEMRFRKDQNSMVICSTLFAASFNLETGLNCYHAHFSWNQDDNKQAESRIRRKTSNLERSVMSYYATALGTVSEAVLDVLNMNTHVNNMTYQDFHKIRKALEIRL